MYSRNLALTVFIFNLVGCIAVNALAQENVLKSSGVYSLWDLNIDASLNAKGRFFKLNASIEGTDEITWSYYGFASEFGLAIKKPIAESPWTIVLEGDIFATKFANKLNLVPGYALASGMQYSIGRASLEGLLYYQYEEILFHSYGMRLASFYKIANFWELGIKLSMGRYALKLTEVKMYEQAIALALRTTVH